MKLGNLKELEAAFKNEKHSKIKILHRFIFENDGDRQNRKRLRDFSGFSFKIDSSDFKNKIENVKKVFKLCELIMICDILCINKEGSATEIINRIVTYLCDLNLLKENIIHDNEIEDDICSETETENIESNVKEKSLQLPVQEFNNITFNDIQDIIVPFSGNSYENINNWIQNFENTIDMFHLSDLYKLVYAKRLLTGKAKLFIQSETQVNSWSKLKQLLISEFEIVTNSAELHQMLAKRKMKQNESLDEYFLIMKELCTRGNIEDAALIQYVINGIPDPVMQKSILYDCKNVNEFKQKLKIYDKMRSDYQKSKQFKPKIDFQNCDKNKTFKVDSRCYNCGLSGHTSKNCRNKDKGPRCFKCSSFGHKSYDCQKKEIKNRNETNLETTHIMTEQKINFQNLLIKEVTLFKLTLNALIDTGSMKTLLKESLYYKISNSVDLESTNIKLSGLGNSIIKPIGFFKTKIEIDNFEFESNIYVVNDKSLCVDLIIGIDVIQQGTLTVSGTEAKLQKLQNDDFLVNLSNVVNKEITDLNHIPKSFKDEEQQLISSYKPQKTNEVKPIEKFNSEHYLEELPKKKKAKSSHESEEPMKNGHSKPDDVDEQEVKNDEIEENSESKENHEFKTKNDDKKNNEDNDENEVKKMKKPKRGKRNRKKSQKETSVVRRTVRSQKKIPKYIKESDTSESELNMKTDIEQESDHQIKTAEDASKTVLWLTRKSVKKKKSKIGFTEEQSRTILRM